MCVVKSQGTQPCWGKAYSTHLCLCVYGVWGWVCIREPASDYSSAALPLCFRWDSPEASCEMEMSL